jgi:methionyl-tRNA formyltransferase
VTAPAPTVFFGSGAFAVPILEELLRAPEVSIVGVVTVPDRPAGRQHVPAPTPVAARARALGIPVLRPASLRTPAAVDSIRDLRPGLGVLADYGRIVPPSILDLPAAGILNVHPSLLPRWRGASPIPATILAGDTETGVTVIRMDAGLDSGPIVGVERWALDGIEDAPGLEARAATTGGQLVRRLVGPWLRGEIVPRPQGEDGMTLTRPLRREDGLLDPTRPASDLERQVRALRPWPGTYIETIAGRIAVLEAAAAPAAEAGTGAPAQDRRPGRLGAEGLFAADGSCLVLQRVQPAGKGPMSWPELLRGRPGLLGSTVIAGHA